MEASYAVQKALRTRLLATAAVVALVPADHILDVNQRPAPDPSVILGEDQVVNAGETLKRDLIRVYSTLHIWKKEPSLAGVKAIAFELTKALSAALVVEDPYRCTDTYVESFRAMRDPDGESSHGVLVVNSMLSRIA